MRRHASRLVLLLLVAALPGCFVNEIDKSMESYEKTRGGAPPAPGAGAAAAAPPAGAPAPAGAQAQAKPSGPSWWATAKTLGSEPMDESIAGCQLAGRVEFMLRDDCLARGGTPQ